MMYLLARGAEVARRAGAVEPMLRLVPQPGLAGAVVPAGGVPAAFQYYGAVLTAVALLAQAEVGRAAVDAAPVRTRLVSGDINY